MIDYESFITLIYPPFVSFFVFSLLATLLTTRKILENWHIWIVVNIVGTIWFAYEHWLSTSVLYLAYLFLAINGLKKWKKTRFA